jgi:hypothetical protein
VDAIVLEYQLGLLDGAVVAAAIKQVRPEIPIVMLADDLELPDGALKSVDALVVKSDGVHFLLATVHFILNVKPAQREEEKQMGRKPPLHLRRLGRSRDGAEYSPAAAALPAPAPKDAPVSPEAWRRILNGTIQF